MKQQPNASQSKSTKQSNAPKNPLDAINLLMSDHREVEKLFEQFEGLSDRSKATKKKVADAICHALNVHTQVEEEIFYPAVRSALKDDDLLDEAVVEHAAAKDLILQIRSMDADDELYDAKVKVLSEQIEHHVHEEEDNMFPQVRQSDIDLIALGEKMTERREEIEAGLLGKIAKVFS